MTQALALRGAKAFVVVFLVSVPLTVIGSQHRSLISDSPFFQWLNSVFIVDYGGLCLVLSYVLENYPGPKTLSPRYYVNKVSKLLVFALSVLAFNDWFFGPLLVERLNVATGGHCSDVASSSMTACAKASMEWINGFDLSGHYYFLLALSLLLMDGLSSSDEINSEEVSFTKFRKYANFAVIFTIGVYVFEFCVTSVFFHTLGEKTAGLISVPITLELLRVVDYLCPVTLPQSLDNV